MIKRQALSTRPKVQTSHSIRREGIHPLQAVMKYLLTLTIGPRTQNTKSDHQARFDDCQAQGLSSTPG